MVVSGKRAEWGSHLAPGWGETMAGETLEALAGHSWPRLQKVGVQMRMAGAL